jgi:hypothetical protein
MLTIVHSFAISRARSTWIHSMESSRLSTVATVATSRIPETSDTNPRRGKGDSGSGLAIWPQGLSDLDPGDGPFDSDFCAASSAAPGEPAPLPVSKRYEPNGAECPETEDSLLDWSSWLATRPRGRSRSLSRRSLEPAFESESGTVEKGGRGEPHPGRLQLPRALPVRQISLRRPEGML